MISDVMLWLTCTDCSYGISETTAKYLVELWFKKALDEARAAAIERLRGDR